LAAVKLGLFPSGHDYLAIRADDKLGKAGIAYSVGHAPLLAPLMESVFFGG
jgi:hypothetical protein